MSVRARRVPSRPARRRAALAWLTVWAGIGTAAGADAGKDLAIPTVRDEPWPVARAARLIARHHAERPPLDSLPLEAEALLAHVGGFDPSIALLPLRPDASERLGMLSIDAPAGRILVPQPGGPAWRSGVHRPVRLADGADPDVARVTGTWLDSGEPVDLKVAPGPATEGGVDLGELGGRDVLRVYSFVAGRTVESATWRLSRRSAGASGAGEPPEPVVLDLRYCAGGDVFEATDFGGLWLGGSRPWTTLHDASGPSLDLRAGSPGGPGIASPGVVLVSEYTASACEQLVLGLARHAGALVLGARTAGKCTVQTAYPLDAMHAIRFTTGRWTGPEGAPCDERGIEPDRHVAGNVHSDVDVVDALLGLGGDGE